MLAADIDGAGPAPSAHLMWYVRRLSPALYRVALGRPMYEAYERMR